MIFGGLCATYNLLSEEFHTYAVEVGDTSVEVTANVTRKVDSIRIIFFATINKFNTDL